MSRDQTRRKMPEGSASLGKGGQDGFGPEEVIRFHEFAEVGEIGGFLEVGIGAELEAAFHVAILGGGAEDDGGNDGTFGMFVEPLEQFKSTAAGHFQVGDDGAGKGIFFAVRVGAVSAEVIDGVLAVGADVDREVEVVFLKGAAEQQNIIAAVAPDCPKIMNTGSIRIDPNAMCELDTHTGTTRFSHCSRFGSSDPSAIW